MAGLVVLVAVVVVAVAVAIVSRTDEQQSVSEGEQATTSAGATQGTAKSSTSPGSSSMAGFDGVEATGLVFGGVVSSGDSIATVVGQDVTGREVEIFDGTPTVVLFVAHWCEVCGDQVKDLVPLADAIGARVVLVMTFTDESATGFSPGRWLEEAGWVGPVILDDVDSPLGTAFAGVGLPRWYAISSDGEVSGQDEGSLSTAEIQALAQLASDSGGLTTTSSVPTTSAMSTVALPASSVSVSASSTLPDDDDGYAAANLLDGSLEFAWNHCGTGCELLGTARQGVGVTLTFRFGSVQELVGFRIANGYQKISDTVGDVWPKNNRVATMEVTTADGSQIVALQDVKGFQEVALEPSTTAEIVIEVLTVYEGDGTYNDLAISEIAFLVMGS